MADSDSVAPHGVDSLIDDLVREGRRDSTGEFTLSRAEARRKLRQFQLASSETWVAEVVAAAVLKGATHVAVQVGRREVEVRFDGRGFTGEDLERLYDHVTSNPVGDDALARQSLAVALNAVASCDLKHLRLESHGPPGTAEPEGGVELELWAQGEQEPAERIGPLATRSGAPAETVLRARFHTRERQEAQVVRRRCCYATVEVLLNGERISHGPKPGPLAVAVEELKGSAATGAIAWEWQEHAAQNQAGEMRLVRGGVWIASQEVKNTFADFHAVVEAPALRLDLSRRGIVHDDALGKVLVAVQRALSRAKKKHRVDQLLDESARTRTAVEAARTLGGPLAHVSGWLVLGLVFFAAAVVATFARGIPTAVLVTTVIAGACLGLLWWTTAFRKADAFNARYPRDGRGRRLALRAVEMLRPDRDGIHLFNRALWARLKEAPKAKAIQKARKKRRKFLQSVGWASGVAAVLEIGTTLTQLGSDDKYEKRQLAELAAAGKSHLAEPILTEMYIKGVILMPGLAMVLLGISALYILRRLKTGRALVIWGCLALLVMAEHTLFVYFTTGPIKAGYHVYQAIFIGFPLYLMLHGSRDRTPPTTRSTG